MQILGGRYGGLPVQTLKKAPYRPTTARVRKSLFDMLGDLRNYRVLDLFAGSGILGFEAASRGASEIIFVDQNSLVCNLIRKNMAQFQGMKGQIVRSEVLRFLAAESRTFDLVFADPPYRYDYMDSLVESALEKLNPDGRFVLESSTRVFPISPSRVKTYGRTQITIWKSKS